MDPENVKERLNTLLHKKLSENERKNKEAESLNDGQEDHKETIDKKQTADGRSSSKGDNEKYSNPIKDADVHASDYCTHFLLHEILSEKKKALLQNKEVMEFLKNKANFDN